MPQRRNLGGARREASERVTLRGEGPQKGEIQAWTLNVSRGGLRLIVEDPVELGFLYSVAIGEAPARPARVVWLREEADGQIAGMQFEDVEDAEVPGSTPPLA